ncbi:MAG: 5-(carboxyamino)imidazole ribonucleotide mutase [Verrucomicrobiota bacterium]|nr:5-(carboxyamino)imidazole ribonucleotide mutase [Verrucomicrobiota bacterium]
MSNSNTPCVGVIMGSQSDWPTLEKSVQTLDKFGVSWEAKVVSAHRTPDLLFDYAKNAESRGLKCLIAGAGGAAHLPGMTASMTSLPVLGVPIKSKTLQGVDSLLSIVQMPAGIPTATFAIGESGATNAALFAVSILASAGNEELLQKLKVFRDEQRKKVEHCDLPPEES